MAYFANLNKFLYNLENNQYNAKIVTNILQRSAFLREIAENTAISYEYQIKDSDTPEIIAHKLYGDANRHWIVLLYNKIMNPYYDFPLKQKDFEKFLTAKYGYDSNTLMSTLHHYEKQILKEYYEYNALKYSNLEKYIVNTKKVDYDTGELSSFTEGTPTVGSPVNLVSESFTETFSSGNYIDVTATLVFISVYDYEFDINESKRTIKLLDSKYVSAVESELKALMQNG
jgi:hypothetical protein